MIFDLAFIWAILIAFAVLTYVVLDGFDLGLGILFPFGKSERDRDLMMNSVAPVWDATRHGWYSAAAAFSPFFHWPTLSLCPRFICPSR